MQTPRSFVQSSSGHVIKNGFTSLNAGGSIPPNVVDDETPTTLMKFGNNSANDQYTERCKAAGIKIHPARFPPVLPESCIRMLTDENDLVVDPFAGSNTTGMVAENLGRRWIAMERVEEYLVASKFRFDDVDE